MLHSVAMLTRTSLHNTTVIEKYIPMLEASVSYTVHTNIYNNLQANANRYYEEHNEIPDDVNRLLSRYSALLTAYSIPPTSDIINMIKSENSQPPDSNEPSPENIRNTRKKAKLENNKGKLMKKINKARRFRNVSYKTLLNLQGRSKNIARRSRRVSFNPNNNIRRIPGRHELRESTLLDTIKGMFGL
jgi:hypothetical protein